MPYVVFGQSPSPLWFPYWGTEIISWNPMRPDRWRWEASNGKIMFHGATRTRRSAERKARWAFDHLNDHLRRIVSPWCEALLSDEKGDD